MLNSVPGHTTASFFKRYFAVILLISLFLADFFLGKMKLIRISKTRRACPQSNRANARNLEQSNRCSLWYDFSLVPLFRDGLEEWMTNSLTDPKLSSASSKGLSSAEVLSASAQTLPCSRLLYTSGTLSVCFNGASGS